MALLTLNEARSIAIRQEDGDDGIRRFYLVDDKWPSLLRVSPEALAWFIRLPWHLVEGRRITLSFVNARATYELQESAEPPQWGEDLAYVLVDGVVEA